MACRLAITPQGHLILDRSYRPGDSGQESAWAGLADAFSRGAAHGLIELARRRGGNVAGDGPELAFWGEFAEGFLSAVAHAPESADAPFPDSIPMPPGTAQELTLRIPAMRGAEYASPAVFASLWDTLVQVAREEAGAHGGLRRWLASVNPALRLVGRVTFHLAENRRSTDLPFAFMSTYTHRLAGGERPVHLPLARALQEYAGARNQTALRSLLEPVQRAAEASAWVRLALESRAVFQPQAWSPTQAYAFLREIPVIEAAGIITRIPNWWRNGRGPRPKVSVQVGGAGPGGVLGIGSLLDFSVELSLGGRRLTRREWEEVLRSGEGLISLRGQWVEVDRGKLLEVLQHWENVERHSAGDGISFLDGMRLLAGFHPGAGTGERDGAVADWSEVLAGDALRDVLEKLDDPSRAAGFDPNEGLAEPLRPYQETGVKWLWFLHRLGLGACLADDMGLGKTLQVIALLVRLKGEAGGPATRRRAAEAQATSLLVAPASLLANWMAEIRRFAPSLRAVVLHPSETSPERWKDARAGRALLEGCDLALTTYGQATRLGWLAERTWRLLILDEAQAIKNPASNQARAAKRIPARTRIALSGTPVENRLGDLWSLYDFLNPGLLGSSADFTRAIKRMQSLEPPDFAPLRRLVRPYLLRRLKTDRRIIADLPDKTELTVWCALAKPQAALYQQAVADLAEKLGSAPDGIQRRGLVLAFLMRLKQICNHPSHWLADGAFDPAKSGKFARLAELVEEIGSRQEKALVFTQFSEMTAPLAGYLGTLFGRPGLILHGGTPVKRRRELVDAFAREDGPPFFVLSLKAGGTGLNLTAANHVIHFDRWWNPAVENQATDRAYRIGQRRNVLVHKFVCRGTVEERIDALIASKIELAESVLGPKAGPEALLTEMDNQELLRFVALDIRSAMGE